MSLVGLFLLVCYSQNNQVIMNVSPFFSCHSNLRKILLKVYRMLGSVNILLEKEWMIQRRYLCVTFRFII